MSNRWLEHVEKFKKKHPDLKHSDALSKAKHTYKKMEIKPVRKAVVKKKIGLAKPKFDVSKAEKK